MITVKPSSGQVCVLTEPKTYTPRKIKSRQLKLAREFDNRIGDPNVGGSSREKLMTVYRQDALRCALILDRLGDLSPKEVGRKADVKQAGRILQKNYYGWFERVERGVYRVSNIGKTNLETYKEYLDSIAI